MRVGAGRQPLRSFTHLRLRGYSLVQAGLLYNYVRIICSVQLLTYVLHTLGCSSGIPTLLAGEAALHDTAGRPRRPRRPTRPPQAQVARGFAALLLLKSDQQCSDALFTPRN